MNGVVIGGTRSGVGKTVATLAVIRALEAAGHTVQPAKAGPDFIDPSHHTAIVGSARGSDGSRNHDRERVSRTLDAWLEGIEGLRRNYARGDGDICVVEGVMGLYDGDRSSTAMVAETLDLPVVLVVDASAGMESVAATAVGFERYAAHAGRDIEVAGIIAQRAHGGRHERGIKEALPDDLTYFGRIPPEPDLEIPDRHLGLHMGDEAPIDPATLDEVAAGVRTDRLLDIAREPPTVDPGDPGLAREKRVAVARDEAFRFVYPATMERLRARSEVVTFAPAAGDDVPPADGIYLPGGYPELHAATIADGPVLATLRDRAAEGVPILGECGGMMALAESLMTVDGDTHEMAGVLPAEIEMCDRYQALDHVELSARESTLTANANGSLRGHEFHYSDATVGADARFAFDVERGKGIDGEHDGLTEHRTLGTYAHVHPESTAFDRFVDAL
ncbi:cobyrinic acid a,c-diamide synthase [Halococcus saccharolyticus]|uniref:Cobyrinic acid a,c-diamide synthase n=1 Tax=Halococcus saccharolyticus DSM 5350 TaxID=1227455 RepID=M0MK84_9EURY|nr:cobyrinic acid a,c-diamide synthase [Halococcus saccharolyticus]EMA44860.1 cobyrinic acid a,c-diamide synthase [Halococcus saccharolyticus DSM 5350]